MFILKQSSLASILFLSVVVSAFDNCTNRTPLGMRNGFIRADQLSASSQYNDEYSANAGRLSSANGWCTNEYKDQSLEWYQVQFDYVTILTGIALQGGVYVDNYITKFTLQYSLKENGDLVTFLNGQIFDGVSKNTDVAYVWFLYSIAALRIRVFANGLGTNKHMCLRIELFGCLNYTLEEMGMESEIIADSQIIVSNGMAASSARMNTKSEGLYSSGNLNVTVDLKNVMMVDAVAIKGSSNYLLGKNFVKSYWVHLGNNTNNQKLIDEYPGNIKNGVSPALSFLNTTQVGSVIKIQSKEVSKDKNYMTLEVYGKHSICADLLPLDNVNMSSKVYFTVMDAYIDSPFTWCATFEDKKPFIMIELRQVYLVSGINVQGDSNKDAWVKSFELSFGILKNKMYSTNEVYKGSIGRIFPYSLNWFSRLMLAKYIRVTLKDWENECCMRVHVRGCLKALDAPSELLIKEDINGELLLEWKKPEFAPISVQKYVISVQSIKPYNNSFFFSNSYETSSDISWRISVDFHAALFNIFIDAFYDEDYYARRRLQYYSKPTSPPAPIYEVFYSFNGYTEVFECQFYSVSDVNGPVSFYEIIISEKEVSSLEMKTLTLRDQITAKSLNLSYFLASSFSSKNFVTRSLKFYEGLETVDGLNVSLPTIASLFLYIRAVIKPSEENYSNMTYYGNVMKWNIVRKTLPQKELQWDKSVGHVIELVKGPPNTLVYEVVVMKINTSSYVKNATSTYTQFKVYETAGYNEPYITASFNTSMYEKYRHFVLGNNYVFTVEGYSWDESHENEKSIKSYFNGKLSAGQTYTLFQRIHLDNGHIYTGPWLPEFNASVIALSSFNEKSNGNALNYIALAAVPVFIVVLVVFLFKRKQMRSLNKKVQDHKLVFSALHENTIVNDFLKKQDLVCYDNIQSLQKYLPLVVNDFVSYYLNAKKNNSEELVAQFQSIPEGKIYPHEEAAKYQKKNRYLNIVPYDHTLVKLVPDFSNDQNTYINANYIESYSKKNMYIATQAPNQDTIVDFWRMIFDKKPKAIVMLTNLIENGKHKSAMYWPEKGSEVYGGLNVCVTKTECFADYIIRYISLNFGEIYHHLLHMQFTSWPDHGCPEYPTMLLNFCHRFRCLVPYSTESLVVVHCSAGVGRTGTFLLINEMLELIKAEQKVDIFNYFEAIRQNRMQMIQSKEQYIFVYDAIYEAVTCGQTSVSVSSFPTTLNKLLTQQVSSGTTLIEEELNLLRKIAPAEESSCFKIALQAENLKKNRHPEMLPRDCALVSKEPYLNAVFVDGYKRKQAFIAAQCPLKNTVKDFWFVLNKLNVSTIVYLTSHNEQKEVSYFKFFPSDGDLDLDGVNVKLVSEEKLDYSIKRNLVVSAETESNMCLLEFSFWSEHCLPNYDFILHLISEIMKSQQSLGNGIIAVVCKNGVSCCGTFISCFNALEQLKLEELVDVFQVVRRAQLSQTQFVQNMLQYEYIYKLMKHYLETFSTYSNFQ